MARALLSNIVRYAMQSRKLGSKVMHRFPIFSGAVAVTSMAVYAMENACTGFFSIQGGVDEFSTGGRVGYHTGAAVASVDFEEDEWRVRASGVGDCSGGEELRGVVDHDGEAGWAELGGDMGEAGDGRGE
jgi:hypothetical protein